MSTNQGGKNNENGTEKKKKEIKIKKRKKRGSAASSAEKAKSRIVGAASWRKPKPSKRALSKCNLEQGLQTSDH